MKFFVFESPSITLQVRFLYDTKGKPDLDNGQIGAETQYLKIPVLDNGQNGEETQYLKNHESNTRDLQPEPVEP